MSVRIIVCPNVICRFKRTVEIDARRLRVNGLNVDLGMVIWRKLGDYTKSISSVYTNAFGSTRFGRLSRQRLRSLGGMRIHIRRQAEIRVSDY